MVVDTAGDTQMDKPAPNSVTLTRMPTYESTHPWLTFDAKEINTLHPRLWMLLGESLSKCDHLAGTPLKPALAEYLYGVTLIKGAQATTAIEGNTLTEDQVRGIFDGTYKAPPSREYQEREVRNVLDVLSAIGSRVQHGERLAITSAFICDINRQLLAGLADQLDESTVAGELRHHSVTVGNYRGSGRGLSGAA
jgi:hypothetical protein